MSARYDERIAWLGFWTVFSRESMRYLKLAVQTVFAPFLSQLLFLAVFGGMYAGRGPIADGTDFLRFLVPGTVIAGAVLTAFQNPVFSIISMKYQGTLKDYCLYPISPLERFAAFALSGAVRGVLVGAMVYAASGIFAGFPIARPVAFWVYVFAVSFLAAGAGTALGFSANNYERGNFVTGLILTPAMFLSGVYYDYRAAGGLLGEIARYNPLTAFVSIGRDAYLGQGFAPRGVELACAALFLAGVAAWTMTTIASEKGLKTE